MDKNDKNIGGFERHRMRYELLVAAGVACVTFIVYLPALGNGFVNWDDNDYVLNNPYIWSLNVAFLKWAFWGFHVGNWHPLTWLSHALDYAIWGLNPRGHHLTNIILHVFNTFLVVLLAIRLINFSSKKKEDGDSRFSSKPATLIAAGMTGLLFGIHPVHVESVAWVAERKDVLCGFFFLLSILTYLNYYRHSASSVPAGRPAPAGDRGETRQKWYYLSLCLFVLALMSKPMAVSLPLVVLILDWYPLERISSPRSLRSAFLEKTPFFALSLISAVVTFLAQRAGGAMGLMETVPLGSRIVVASRSLIAYLWQMLFPMKLSPSYPYPKDSLPLSPEYVVAIVLVGGITIACIAVARTRKLWPASWAYYVVTLLPVLGLVQVGGQAMADRYTYLPSLAPFILAGGAAAWGLKRMRGALRGLSVVLDILLILVLAVVTSSQIRVWKNSVSLWTAVIQKEPTNAPRAYTNLGSALSAEGRFSEAIDNFDKALQLDPDDFLAYSNRGSVLEKTGRFSEALADFDRAIGRNPKGRIAYFNRGSTLAKMGKFEEAIMDFDRVIALAPDDYLAYSSRAAAFERIGEIDKAISDLDRVIAIYPAYSEAYARKGVLYGLKGFMDEAIRWLSRSIEMQPDFVYAYFNRAVAYSLLQRRREAREDFTRVISLDPYFVEAYTKRGDLSLSMGDTGSAISDFRRACDLGNEYGCEIFQRLSAEKLFP